MPIMVYRLEEEPPQEALHNTISSTTLIDQKPKQPLPSAGWAPLDMIFLIFSIVAFLPCLLFAAVVPFTLDGLMDRYVLSMAQSQVSASLRGSSHESLANA